MAINAEEAIRDHLATAGLGTLGTSMFSGPMIDAEAPSPVLDAAMFCMEYGGPRPVPYMGQGGKSNYIARVQVTIRGDRRERPAAKARGELVISTLHCASVSGWEASFADQPTPTWLRFDDKERPLYTVNVELWKTE